MLIKLTCTNIIYSYEVRLACPSIMCISLSRRQTWMLLKVLMEFSLYDIILYTNNPVSFGAMSIESERKRMSVFTLKETE